MAPEPDALVPSTTAATAAVAQSRTEGGAAPDGVGALRPPAAPDAGGAYVIGDQVTRGAYDVPYERQPDDPLYRPLRIYTLDPTAARADGAVAIINVPYEPLAPGPTGALFRVDPHDVETGERYRQLDPESREVLIRSGRTPSPADPRFHQQMVYAVCSAVYATFRSALGRHIAWGFERSDGETDSGRRRTQLVLRPHGGLRQNACYDPRAGELRFGYYEAGESVEGRNVPGGYVFTCLSHDIVAHEVTHALLDGLRTRFSLPTGPDVLGFHEGFADLVALLQHFSYPDVVRAAVRRAGGGLAQVSLLTDLARQFGHTTGRGGALRSAISVDPATGAAVPRRYHRAAPPHEMGGVLVSAVFEAYLTVYLRKTERYVRLATGGSTRLPPEPNTDLQAVLAEEASQLASQFLAMCIRAIDYCPPVDMELGEYLRAVITADYNLVPDDRWNYREAWIDAFGTHGIYPPYVRSLAEDELLWKAPERPIAAVRGLSFSELKFRGDPGSPAGEAELRRQAHEVGRTIAGHLPQFGLAAPDDPRLGGDPVDPPCVQSVRSSRRVGPDGQVVFDLVAEVTQRRVVRRDGESFEMHGGATVLLGPKGEVRYVIAKNVANEGRLARQRQFMRAGGRRYWTAERGLLVARDDTFALLDGGAGDAEARAPADDAEAEAGSRDW
jgi:hypothetical protein